MKKISLVMLLAALVLVFASCSLFTSDTTRLTVTKTPKTQYTVGEAFDWVGFEAIITKGSTESKYGGTEAQEHFELTFSSATEGTFTATLNYKADSSLSYSFDYTVRAADNPFTSGTGTYADPYVITTADQIQYIGEDTVSGYYGDSWGNKKNNIKIIETKYYKLGNDLDITGAKFVVNDWYHAYSLGGSFVLDGNGYTLTLGRDAGITLFAFTYQATIKNINVIYSSKLEHSGFLVLESYDELTFSDMTIKGHFTQQQNEGALLCWGNEGTTVNVIKCTNYANVYFEGYASAYIGYLSKTGKANFTSCENKGSLEGNQAYIYVANPQQGSQISYQDCVNSGEVSGAHVNIHGVNVISSGTKDSYQNGYVDNEKKTYYSEVQFKNASADCMVILQNLMTENSKDVSLKQDGSMVTVALTQEEILEKIQTAKGLTAVDETKLSVQLQAEAYVNANGTIYIYTDYVDGFTGLKYCTLTDEDIDSSLPEISDVVGAISSDMRITGTLSGHAVTSLVNNSKTIYRYFVRYDGEMLYTGSIVSTEIPSALAL